MSEIYRPLATCNGEEAKSVTVTASYSQPWRRAEVEAEVVTDALILEMSGVGSREHVVFEGVVDNPDAVVREVGKASARGLAEWRRVCGPKGFQDVRPEIVLQWLASEVGGRIAVQVQGGRKRHYVLRRGPAWQILLEVLAAWEIEAVTVELDDGVLYVGPEEDSPHATAGQQFAALRGENILAFQLTGTERYSLKLPLMPWLRVGHRGNVEHPMLSAAARILEVLHQYGPENRTVLTVEVT